MAGEARVIAELSGELWLATGWLWLARSGYSLASGGHGWLGAYYGWLGAVARFSKVAVVAAGGQGLAAAQLDMVAVVQEAMELRWYGAGQPCRGKSKAWPSYKV